MPRPP